LNDILQQIEASGIKEKSTISLTTSGIQESESEYLKKMVEEIDKKYAEAWGKEKILFQKEIKGILGEQYIVSIEGKLRKLWKLFCDNFVIILCLLLALIILGLIFNNEDPVETTKDIKDEKGSANSENSVEIKDEKGSANSENSVKV